MADIITDLQNATTGTRELDARLLVAMHKERGVEIAEPPTYGEVWYGKRRVAAPHYTTRPEGLRLLMDYVRERWPEAEIEVSVFGNSADALIYLGGGQACEANYHHPDPAIALAIAILKAKGARGDD